jgi:hypothetical protein
VHEWNILGRRKIGRSMNVWLRYKFLQNARISFLTILTLESVKNMEFGHEHGNRWMLIIKYIVDKKLQKRQL